MWVLGLDRNLRKHDNQWFKTWYMWGSIDDICIWSWKIDDYNVLRCLEKFWFVRRKLQQVVNWKKLIFGFWTDMYRYIRLMHRFIRPFASIHDAMHRFIMVQIVKQGLKRIMHRFIGGMYRFISSYASIHDAYASMHAAVMHRFMWMHRFILADFWKMRKIQLFRKRFRS